MSQSRTFIIPLLVMGAVTWFTPIEAFLIAAAIVDVRFIVVPWLKKWAGKMYRGLTMFPTKRPSPSQPKWNNS
jgi:hypothetical protein